MRHPTRRREPRSHNRPIKPDPDSSANNYYPDPETHNFGAPPTPSAASSYGGSTTHIPPDQAFYRHGRSDAREYLITTDESHKLTKLMKRPQVNAPLNLNLY